LLSPVFPVGLGTMGGIVVAGMVVSILRANNPAFGGPMPEGARAFLEGWASISSSRRSA
jgi:hypothetical protein